MDLTKFRHTLWDVLTRGDSVKVRSVILNFPLCLLLLLNITLEMDTVFMLVALLCEGLASLFVHR